MRSLTSMLRLAAAAATLGLMISVSAFADYTVTGRFQYQDREFDINGFTGTLTPRPIRFANVQIMAGNTQIATGATGEDGSFSIGVSGSIPQQIWALCISNSSRTPGILLQVRYAVDPYTITGELYSVTSATQTATGTAAVDLGATLATADTDVGKAFNIWDVVIDSMQFISSSGVQGTYPSRGLTVIWRGDYSGSNSFFSAVGSDRYIYINGPTGYDDTVIAHEFGHFQDFLYSRSSNPGGTHYLGDDNQDMRLSWGEGLATFLGSSVRKYKGYATPEIYISTDGRNLNFSYEIERITGGRNTIASRTGSTNEVAVSATLWDIIDGPSDYSPAGDDDQVQRPFAEVWRVLTEYFNSVTPNAYSIETFWNGWLATYNPSGSDLPAIQDLFNKVNGIEFIADAQEPDNTSALAPVITLPQRPALVSGPKVVISELDLGSIDSAELYNAGDVEADLTGWTLEASAPGYSTTVFFLPPFKLAPGAFVVLSEASGTNTNSVLYFNNNISWGNGAGGACALKDSKGVGIDFVRWGNSTEPVPNGTSFNVLNPASPQVGRNLTRNFAETDTDSGGDWSPQTSSLGTYNISGQDKHYTFYPVNDVDFAAFTATRGNYYMAETFRLFDSADTILDIVAADGVTVLATNDDYGNSKASRLAWTAPSSGKYFARARRFDGASNYAQYGSYDLRVIESVSPFSLALPQILTVSQPGQGGKFQYLADAIVSAANGDTIQVMDNGVYPETLTISGKSLILKAGAGKNPIIDGRSSSALSTVRISNAKTVKIDGITILAGRMGIAIAGGNVTISNSIITGASDPSYADGIYVTGAGSTATIVNCTIINNNRAGVSVFSKASVKVANSIVTGNSLLDIGGDGTATSLVVKNSLVGTGGFSGTNGNITGDPRFVDQANNDFHLKSTSPAIDAGDATDPDLPPTDADGLPRSINARSSGTPIPDMGAYEYLPPGSLTSTSIFPQIAAGGTNPPYRTSIVGINTGAVAANVNLSLTKSDGNPFPITVLNSADTPPGSITATPEEAAAAIRSGNSFNFSIPPAGLARYEASASGDTTAGYAILLSSSAVTGTALFKTMSNGLVQSEAGVGLSKPTKSFFVYIDNLNNAVSGYAIANFGSTPVNLTLALRDAGGQQKDSTAISLLPGKHMAEFVTERFKNTATPGFEGSIEFASDQPVAAVALRYDNAASDVFSTIPVLVDEASTTLYFPQVADGGGNRTNFILVNPTATPTSAKLEFFQDDGTPLGLPIGGSVKTSVEVPLTARGVAHMITDGTIASTKAGWVRVTSPAAIGGSAIFQTFSGSRILSEAGVSSSVSAVHSTAYVSSVGPTESGLAISNPNSTAVTVTLKLRDITGQIVTSTSIPLSPLGHIAKFFTQWFPNGYGEFEGTLEIVATAPVSAVALRYDNTHLDNAQLHVFATLPVIVIP